VDRLDKAGVSVIEARIAPLAYAQETPAPFLNANRHRRSLQLAH
jgi:hypothetical protein